MSASGRVILVGAGPGDPGLLTRRGAEALAASDVVLYDELASPDLLSLVRPGARCINVGKRGHDAPTRSQDDVQALLLEHARAGRTVVRLKGGDAFVFGRGGEEASACAAAGIPCEVVPGVSAALAAPAAAGVPVTDRRYSASFAVVTGHKDPTRVSEETRWADLAKAVDTLVILMGMRNLAQLVERMLAGGADPETPAIAVMNGTLPSQRVVESPLRALPGRVDEAGIGAPAAVVVGNVVRLRSELGGIEARPLFGMRALVTRPVEAAEELSAALCGAGAEAVRVPLLAFSAPEDLAPLRDALARAHAQNYDAVLLASPTAARFYASACSEFGDPGTAVACLGPGTARVALDLGLPLRLVASGAGAESWVAELGALLPLRGKRFLLPRSDLGREALGAGLRDAGAVADEVVAYRNHRPAVDAEDLSRQIAAGELPILTLASPSAAERLLEVLTPEARASLSRCIVAAIGETTAKALRKAGVEPVVAERPDPQALVEALVERVHGGEKS